MTKLINSSFFTCFSLSHTSSVLRSGTTHNQNAHPKLSVSAENVKQSDPEEINSHGGLISSEFLEERIGSILGPLSDHILALTRTLN